VGGGGGGGVAARFLALVTRRLNDDLYLPVLIFFQTGHCRYW
jgi:DNA topoisomerase VI subunit A